MDTMWSPEEMAEVKRLFGDASRTYGLALTHNPELVNVIDLAVNNHLSEETLIQQMTSGGDESKIDPDCAAHLLRLLLMRRDAKQLLVRLRQNRNYQNWDQVGDREAHQG